MLNHFDAVAGLWETEARRQLDPGADGGHAVSWRRLEKQTRKGMPSMANYNDRSGGPARLDRRNDLHRSAAGLAIPVAVAMSGLPEGKVLAGATTGPVERGVRSQVANNEGLDQARLERLREVLTGHAEREQVPGLVTGIDRGGEVVVDAIGTLAFDSDVPMGRNTIFRIASVTKPITAVAALILIEEGMLRLDDPVDELLPELADRQVLRAIDGPLRRPYRPTGPSPCAICSPSAPAMAPSSLHPINPRWRRRWSTRGSPPGRFSPRCLPMHS